MANRLITQVESEAGLLGAIVANVLLNKLDQIIEYKDGNEVTVKGGNRIPLEINDKWFFLDTDVDLSTAADLDTGFVAAGTDYYVYACDNAGTLVFLISAASTFPTGYNANTSRKLGGFHTICAAVDHETGLTAWSAGTVIAIGETRKASVWDGYMYRCIVNGMTHATTEPTWSGISVGDTIVDNQVTWIKEQHALEGAAAADILPASVWDLKHRAKCGNNAGMVYDTRTGIWVDIYLASGTGASTVSANGGIISDNRNWMDFADDVHAVGKRLLSNEEFQSIAAGSNEETNITGSTDPVTTGGHSDTAGRRMISTIGCEDCCGVMWQWIHDQAYCFGPATNHTHNVTVSGNPETVTSGDPSSDVAPGSGYYNLPGAKGSLYLQGSSGDIKLIVGGNWNMGTKSGSRCCSESCLRWLMDTDVGFRGWSGSL